MRSNASLAALVMVGPLVLTCSLALGATLVLDGGAGSSATGDPCPDPPDSTNYQDLRQAIECAASGDTIEVLAGTYTGADNRVINIEKDLALVGEGPADTVFDGEDIDDFFFVNADSFELRGMTFRRAAGNGILNFVGEHALVENMRFLDSTTISGGPVRCSFASMDIRNSMFAELSNPGNAGGFEAVSCEATIESSLFSNTQADNLGNAIYATSDSNVEVVNTTFTGESADSGDVIVNSGAQVSLVNVTVVSHNTAALRVNGPSAIARLSHVIFADNQSAQGNCWTSNDGTVLSDGYNLFDDSGCPGDAATTDLLDTDPELGPLTNNGGPTATMATQAGTPARRSGALGCTLTDGSRTLTDQRGMPRIPGVACDRGAYQHIPGGEISDVVFDPSDPDIRYALTLGSGIFKSTDGGGLWSGIFVDQQAQVATSLLIDPRNPDILLLATLGGGIFRSENGGDSWVSSSAGLGTPNVRVLRRDPLDPDRIYAGTDQGIFLSADNGVFWLEFGDGLP